MIIKEVDSRLTDFIGTNVCSVRDIIKKRLADLVNKDGKDYRKEIFLDKKNILRPKHRLCVNSQCRSTNVKWNGFHNTESFIIKSIGMAINIGQCECKDCGLRWSVDIDELYLLIEKLKELVREFATQIRSEKNSLENTAELIKTLIGRPYSHMSIQRWYKAKTNPLEERKIKDENCSGYYLYDEQEVRAECKKKQRLSLRDVTIKQPIAEEIKDDREKETIRKFLVENLKNKPRIAMTVDGNPAYPEIIAKDLNMNYQSCIKHLFDNIRKAFKDECAYGVGHKKLHLIDELKKQELYDVFYPRSKLISFVEAGVKELAKIKDEDLREERDIELQKELLKLKKERKKERRRKNYVHEHISYIGEEARKKFEKFKRLNQNLPKNIEKLVNKIEEDWEHYTLFLVDRNVPPTSNRIEQYFSSTLQRSQKKKFRKLESLNGLLKIERIKHSEIFLSLISVLGLSFIDIIGLFLKVLFNL